MTNATKRSSRTGLHLGGTIFVIAVCSAALWVIAGQLDPPPGPIMPTNRVQLNQQTITLPYTISEPGSYVLTSNLTGTPGNDGIIIDSNGVTLDLNGFALVGGAGTGNGIRVEGSSQSSHTAITIRNGAVTDWAGSGIDATFANGGHFENLSLRSNGVDGMFVGQGNTVVHCESTANGHHGFIAALGSVFVGCTAKQNGSIGIRAESATVADCTLDQNQLNGMQLEGFCTVTGCTVTRSGSIGIFAWSGSTINANTLVNNQGPCVEVKDSCFVVGNTCRNNGTGPGFRVTEDRNRIEGNHVAGDSGDGFEVSGTGNVIIRNSASVPGTGYAIVPGNTVGPIVTGTGTITSGNPWANFEF